MATFTKCHEIITQVGQPGPAANFACTLTGAASHACRALLIAFAGRTDMGRDVAWDFLNRCGLAACAWLTIVGAFKWGAGGPTHHLLEPGCPVTGLVWPELGSLMSTPARWGCRHLGDIAKMAGSNSTQAALEPLFSGIGGRFADWTGIAKPDYLWGLVQACFAPSSHRGSAASTQTVPRWCTNSAHCRLPFVRCYCTCGIYAHNGNCDAGKTAL